MKLKQKNISQLKIIKIEIKFSKWASCPFARASSTYGRVFYGSREIVKKYVWRTLLDLRIRDAHNA